MLKNQTRNWLRVVLGADVDAVTPMQGATSSAVYLVTTRTRSAPRRFVLRLLSNSDWLAREADLARHEAAVLTTVAGFDVPSPRLVAYADGGQTEHPAVLMTFVEGEVRLRPRNLDAWLARLAQMLAAIHQQDALGLSWLYKSWTEPASLARAAAATPQWARAAGLVAGGPPLAPSVLIHRDYHPVNVLWRDAEISGVVDWINACRGPAGVDVAHCRLNLTLMYGADCAARFLAAYVDAADGFEYQPYWDLDCILGCGPTPRFYLPWQAFGLPPIDEETLQRRLDDHLGNVLDQC